MLLITFDTAETKPMLSVAEIYKIMRKLLAKIIIKYFRKTYFVSGTFEHKNERKWFRIIYQPKTGFVNEEEVKKILELETGYVSKYVVVTFFKKVPFKQYQEF